MTRGERGESGDNEWGERGRGADDEWAKRRIVGADENGLCGQGARDVSV